MTERALTFMQRIDPLPSDNAPFSTMLMFSFCDFPLLSPQQGHPCHFTLISPSLIPQGVLPHTLHPTGDGYFVDRSPQDSSKEMGQLGRDDR